MAKPTKITIEFDDGSRHEIDPTRHGSIFVNADKARASGKKEPWRQPPQTGDTELATTQGAGECYVINGVIVCP